MRLAYDHKYSVVVPGLTVRPNFIQFSYVSLLNGSLSQ